ncbi:MAG: BolA family transcriptional regulator [Betaproteobacteria bacterium]|nr:MAG: BolA family transcriptional regulator [Betaproteobacteria bacterium]
MNIARSIEQKLATLEPSRLELTDDSALHAGHEGAKSGGGHYRLTIVSPQFSGKNTVARHRMIYSALGSMMQRQIHALAIRAYAPDEAETISQP